MNYKKIILLTLMLLSIRIEVVQATENKEWVPPPESEKPIEDSGLDFFDGFFFEPRAIAGSMYYRYQENYDNNNTNLNLQDNIPFLGTGITFGSKNLYFDLYARISEFGIGNDYYESNQTGNEENSVFKRKDYGINLNYPFQLSKIFLFDNENIILSVGYKWGISNINKVTRIIKNPYNRESEDLKFTTSGPTVGINYGSSIGKSSVWGINLAIAKLFSDYSGYNNADNTFTKNTGNTWGVTLGAKWSGAITNQLGYNLSIDAYRYEMDGSFKTINQKNENKFDIIETVFTAKASLSYSFDFF